MTTITTRTAKGSPLTIAEVDANFTNLNTSKAETANPTFTGVAKIDYGTSALPALAFSPAPTTGLYGSATYVGLAQNGLTLLQGAVTSGSNYLNINAASSGVTLSATNNGASTVDAALTLTAKNNGAISINLGSSNSNISIGAMPLNPNTLVGVQNIAIGSGITQAAGAAGYSLLIGTGHVETGGSSGNKFIGANIYAQQSANNNIGIGSGTFGGSVANTNGCTGIGNSWSVDGQDGIALGSASASSYSIALSGQATGTFSFAASGGIAAADYSMALGGAASATSVGQIAFGSDPYYFGNQRGLYILNAATAAGVTPVLLSQGIVAAGTAYSIKILGTGQVVAFKGQIVVKDTGASPGFALFDISGIATSTPLGVITLQASSVAIGLHNGTYATATSANVVLAVAVGGISITVHGLAGTGVSNWCGTFDTTEMVG